MAQRPLTPNGTPIPVKIVGSSTFGKVPIISDERTYNMYIADEWLLNWAGYRQSAEILTNSFQGRGIYTSNRGNFMIIVLGNRVYRVNAALGYFQLVITLDSSEGEVVIEENLSSQIVIVDGIDAYIYNYSTGSLGKAKFVNSAGTPITDIVPNYVTYQNTYFIFGNGRTDSSGSEWYVFESDSVTDPLQLKLVQTLTIQSKPDFAKAVIRIPSAGNNVLVLGSNVGEIWTNVGGQAVYQRNSSINIDYGVASVRTIAASDKMVAWLGINEKSAPAIMVMSGGQAERISSSGIDNLLKRVRYPSDSTAFFVRLDGHVFYCLSFFNSQDNFSLMYDFTTGFFYDLTDWDFTYHPAVQVAYFQNKVFFASRKQPSLMEMSTDIYTMSTDSTNVYQIPQVRKTNTYRLPGSMRFIANQFSFTVENGVEPDVNFGLECQGSIIGESSEMQMYSEGGEPLVVEGGFCQIYRPRIDLSISKNGGETYSSAIPYYMHGTGHYNNQPRFNKLGQANQLTFQLRFWGFGRKVINDGVVEVYA